MSSAAEAGGSRSASRHLVGRDDVLARLESLVDQTVAGHRLGTVLVEGPAGIGKTRVVTELASRLEARGVAVVVGHCVAEGELLPYAPVAELLAGLVARRHRASRRTARPPRRFVCGLTWAPRRQRTDESWATGHTALA
jgi:MoxR-like ATPase